MMTLGAFHTAVLVLGLLGLHGYVYRKAPLSPRFWHLFTPVFLLWCSVWITMNAFAIALALGPLGTIPATVITTMIVLLNLPQLVALVRYMRLRMVVDHASA
ncbi:MAG: hypothetical protein ACK4KV_18225 [Rhodocyclaceae bacterium]